MEFTRRARLLFALLALVSAAMPLAVRASGAPWPSSALWLPSLLLGISGALLGRESRVAWAPRPPGRRTAAGVAVGFSVATLLVASVPALALSHRDYALAAASGLIALTLGVFIATVALSAWWTVATGRRLRLDSAESGGATADHRTDEHRPRPLRARPQELD